MRDVVANSVGGGYPLAPSSLKGRARLAFRTSRFGIRSARSRDWDFVQNAARSLRDQALLAIPGPRRAGTGVVCNLCGWTGRRFFPNTGPGYDERDSLCPGCMASDRYRTLYELLRRETTAFEAGRRVVEVAPLRSLEKIFLHSPGVDYTSFDIERHAMERGDITAMRFLSDSVDWFICFHVLEHIPDEGAAVKEIHRVLKPGGSTVLQVPIDWHVDTTREYPAPDPRDVGHVRRHGRDFADRIARHGFDVRAADISEVFGEVRIKQAGLSREPIFIATKRAG